ncbi:outer dense fiber protein 2 isoform X3 [Pogoniulus pusillus]|uniref:outer dense fiber protein 2 isoform X3 n=1 Tax=Pogoniulus pusillus TaxID=488313 RepID=UPI0030B92FE4
MQDWLQMPDAGRRRAWFIVRQLPGLFLLRSKAVLWLQKKQVRGRAVVFRAIAQNAHVPELVEVLRRPGTVPRCRPQVLRPARSAEAAETPTARGHSPGGAFRRYGDGAVARRSASAAGRGMAGLNRPMREPWAVARRPRKCGGGSCAQCGVPLLASARQQGAHGRGGPSRRLPAASQELLRQPRAPRSPSRCHSSLNNKVPSASAQSPLSRRSKSCRITLKHKQKMKGDSMSMGRAVRAKAKAPWVPPGKTSVRDSPCKWEGPTHRLETMPAAAEKMLSVLHLSDLSADEEDEDGAVQCRMEECGKEIDSLMSAVGALRNEAKLQKKEEQQQARKRLLEEQKEELKEVTQELVETEHENILLRRNIERMREEKDLTVLQKKYLQREKESLMSKLSEAERDGAAAARQIHALKYTIGRLNVEKHMSSSDVNTLTKQKELLLQKLSTFEESNRTLRELLREQHSREKDAQKILEQQGALLKRLADSEAENVQLQMRLQEKEKEVDDLTAQIQTEQEQAKAASELSKSLEAVRGRLQAQLRSKEAENNRLSTRIRNLERSAAQHKVEVEGAVGQLQELRQRAEREKEALKKAARVQKEQAQRAQEYAEQMALQLAQKDSYVAEALSTLESWRSRYNKAVKDKSGLELEIVTLNSRVADLLEQQTALQDRMREDREALMDKLHCQNTESSSFRMENERLRASVVPMEEKLNQAQLEVQQLKGSIRSYEGLIESYKSQVVKAQMEADDMAAKLEKCSKENKTLKDDMSKEIELVRQQFQSQLTELEKLPEILKVKETQLAECQEQLQSYEKKSMDLSVVVADLRQLVIAKREESIHQCQLRLEEKSRECSSLARQLEMAIEDAKRQVEQTRERAASRERAAQSKLLDLETQLSRNKTELNQLRRSKDDAERRFESRLQDLKDRLEQSESTNRSMQSYVQFLKASYDNVFGEGALLDSPGRSHSSP